MSFTAEVKEELSRVAPVCSHCDQATLSALLRLEGRLILAGRGNVSIEIDTDSPAVARLMVRLLHTLYALNTELTMRRSVLHKTPNYLIHIPMQETLPKALFELGLLNKQGLGEGIEPTLIEKRCCQAAFLRGVFLASGFIANPRGDFHFECVVESEKLAEDILALLHTREIPAKMMQRRNAHIIYLKSGSAISDFLALVGAHQGALEMEDARVIKSVRNDVNRLVNAEVANQQKSTAASVEQIMAIRTVVDAYGIEQLPDALQEFIRLRVAHPEATLKELGELADPPLSKSAVYHRVRRIEAMARSLNQ